MVLRKHGTEDYIEQNHGEAMNKIQTVGNLQDEWPGLFSK